MNKHLSDTKVVSELRKPRPHGGVVAWLNHQEEEDQLFLSAVTMGQFQAGIERTRRRDPSMASFGWINWRLCVRYRRWIHHAFGSGAGSWPENQIDGLSTQ
jgi:hypothetical protein